MRKRFILIASIAAVAAAVTPVSAALTGEAVTGPDLGAQPPSRRSTDRRLLFGQVRALAWSFVLRNYS